MIDKLSLRASNLGASASSSDIIHDALRAAIIRGEIEEGQTLRQDAIAKMFNVSRIPVREALKRLEAHGLVTSVRYKGVVVSRISVAEIEEIFEFRATIEPQLIAHSVPRMTRKSIDHAQALCDSFAEEKDAGRWGDLNRQFHSSLYIDAGRPYYFAAAAAANDRVERYIRAQAQSDPWPRAGNSGAPTDPGRLSQWRRDAGRRVDPRSRPAGLDLIDQVSFSTGLSGVL
ncbi:GntR family transcriptional regulator [Devosia algicola]